MMKKRLIATAVSLALLHTAASATPVQIFEQVGGLPAGAGVASSTEDIEFADVDGDGDWDVGFADNTGLSDQNRLWINSGLGEFTDETQERFPSVQDPSRDLDFVDLDGDGDPDVHVTNDTFGVSEPCRFWMNQGAASGFFVDETATRWVGLGGPGSSLPGSAVLPGGGFVSWSNDTDFADFDNDGDLDLFHSSHGPGFSGTTPCRIFLNDGLGFFEEFNPSGVQLSGPNIPSGGPALWAEGTQFAGQFELDGSTTDVAGRVVDVELVDLDGDFDLDVTFTPRTGAPRIFSNRSETGDLSFRDTSLLTFPSQPVASLISGPSDAEPMDFDGDGDLDLYGLNWGAADFDRTFLNDGAGVWILEQASVPGSVLDDDALTALDFNADGDLDVLVAAFVGADKLLEGDGLGSFFPASSVGLSGAGLTLDAASADLDGDGDTDAIVARAGGSGLAPIANTVYRNTTDVADVHAPYLPNVEAVADRSAGTYGVPVRAQVYDNAAQEIARFAPVWVDVRVEGCSIGAFAARSSGGQVFRAELPGNLVGQVEFTWRAEDELGNLGSASPGSYSSTAGTPFASIFGSSTAAASSGVSPTVESLSAPFPGTSWYLAARGTPGAGYLLGVTDSSLASPLPLPGLALVNLGGQQILVQSGTLDSGGCGLLTVQIPESVAPGLALFAQAFTVEPATNGDLLSSSSGLAVTIP